MVLREAITIMFLFIPSWLQEVNDVHLCVLLMDSCNLTEVRRLNFFCMNGVVCVLKHRANFF